MDEDRIWWLGNGLNSDSKFSYKNTFGPMQCADYSQLVNSSKMFEGFVRKQQQLELLILNSTQQCTCIRFLR